jgi:DNA-binding transcriptional ArsR family regulator
MAAYSPEMDDAFRALADSSRRRLLDSLNAQNGQTLRELCAEMDMARQSVSKHLAVLEAAQLVTTVWRGREKLHYLNPAPINEISERWINQYDRDRVRALSDLKRALEDHPMEKPSFVYTSYIRSTPERLWQALTDPAFTERYWGVALDSEWNPGSSITLRIAAEPRSRVAFEIDDLGDFVKLTVTHEGFEPGSEVLETISQGWPHILSNLKTVLETDETLSESQARAAAGQ